VAPLDAASESVLQSPKEYLLLSALIGDASTLHAFMDANCTEAAIEPEWLGAYARFAPGGMPFAKGFAQRVCRDNHGAADLHFKCAPHSICGPSGTSSLRCFSMCRCKGKVPIVEE
jgi:hypothetical protein